MIENMIDSGIIGGVIAGVSIVLLQIIVSIRKEKLFDKRIHFLLFIGIMLSSYIGIKALQKYGFNQNIASEIKSDYLISITDKDIKINEYAIHYDSFKLINEILKQDMNKDNYYSVIDTLQTKSVFALPVFKSLETNNPIYHFIVIDLQKLKSGVKFKDYYLTNNTNIQTILSNEKEYISAYISERQELYKYINGDRKIFFYTKNGIIEQIDLFLISDIPNFNKKN